MSESIPLLELQHFVKWYGKINAIESLDIKINHGETIALLGPNGSGKSTIIRAIAGLHFPSSGNILINGENIQKGLVTYKKLISYMPQRVTMPEYLTAREIITLFAKLKGVNISRVGEIIDFVSLGPSADRYVREYSGGMLQRVGLAIAFLAESEIYLLDEPTLNLDPFGIKRFREQINILKEKQKTIIFASHILEDAINLADRVAILLEGKMIKLESISEFKSRIARETMVRIKLSSPLNGLEKILASSGALLISSNGKTCIFKAEPKNRLAIIRKIEAVGGQVEEFHTDPPGWDLLLSKSSPN
jgi:ABC-type multidrug transport system ATPase subunit